MPDFTLQQSEAATYRKRDTCVVAGPGSGKTTVLVERYRRLLTEEGFEPHQILAITFTEKAAANMKAKLTEQFRHDQMRLRELESAWVSTIHGFCARLLKEHALAAGVDPRFHVLSPRESDRLQWECMQEALDELTATQREQALELIEALHSPQLANDLLNAYEAMRSAGMTVADVRSKPNPASSSPQINIASRLREIVGAWPFGITPKQGEEKARLLDWCREFESSDNASFTGFLLLMDRLGINLPRAPKNFWPQLKELREDIDRQIAAAVDRHAKPFRRLIFDVLAWFDDAYRARKTAQGRVDFNDLERYSITLLENNPEVRRKVHGRFRQIMLDEFQDINGQQNKLISLIRAENVFFGVGDRNQSIYGFRYARPEIFRQYAEEVEAHGGQSVALLDNFRSRAAVLRCVGEVLSGRDGVESRELIAGAEFQSRDTPSIEVLKVLDEAADKESASDREAAWIARRILELHGTLPVKARETSRAAEFRDFAVLCRSGDSMTPILAAFDKAGIPYVCGRSESFLVSREGKDLTVLLKVIANPRDSIALAGLLRGPLVGVSDEALLRFQLDGGSLPGGLNRFAFDPSSFAIPEPDVSKLLGFVRNLGRWRREQPVVPLDLLLSRAVADCGVDWSHATPSGANIESFLCLARTTGNDMDLPSFLREIESLIDAGDSESELSDEDQGDRVQVMTAHAAKGLEFKVTIVAAMDKGPRRESGPVTFTQEHGLGVKWRNPATNDDKEGLKDSWAAANKEVASAREKQEEHRLLYVAMTRAEEHLILSYSCGKNKPPNWAKIVDEYFALHPPAAAARIDERGGFSTSILITDSDPPAFSCASAGTNIADVLPISRPGVEDQHDSSVTVTSLATFGLCPRRYYIQRSLGWGSRPEKRQMVDFDRNYEEDNDKDHGDLSAARVGTIVHEILARKYADSEAHAASSEARELAEVFLRSDLGTRSSSASRAGREWEFIAEIGGTIVRGSVDLWFEENGELHLVDYKTDSIAVDAIPARVREYAPQLAVYAIALERALGKRPLKAWLHFLRLNSPVEVRIDEAALTAAHRLIGDLRKAQNELRFDLNEGDHCRSCPFYRSLCPAGSAIMKQHNEEEAIALSATASDAE